MERKGVQREEIKMIAEEGIRGEGREKGRRRKRGREQENKERDVGKKRDGKAFDGEESKRIFFVLLVRRRK